MEASKVECDLCDVCNWRTKQTLWRMAVLTYKVNTVQIQKGCVTYTNWHARGLFSLFFAIHQVAPDSENILYLRGKTEKFQNTEFFLSFLCPPLFFFFLAPHQLLLPSPRLAFRLPYFSKLPKLDAHWPCLDFFFQFFCPFVL